MFFDLFTSNVVTSARPVYVVVEDLSILRENEDRPDD
jgi:hypothetical protein